MNWMWSRCTYTPAGQQQWSSKLNTCPISKLQWKASFMCENCQCIRLEPLLQSTCAKRPNVSTQYKNDLCLEKGLVASYWSKSHLPRVILSSSSYLLKQYFQHSSLSVHTSSWLATSPCTPFYSSNACQAVKSTKGPRNKKHQPSYRASTAWQEVRRWIYQTRRRW